ncbi:hypothetical protein AUEXF2481DRAFT_5019 [Aureobasidium subglaciale EXF-2481]|uniref:RRM domain-containing protein n=1 Tax=Aureobasidium subglaciale (strain EXF-2481) TaxID=1043005 RepID=A0A074YH52_AURSE|nr:uncharacterized protein AUEXF2481DRAFT_5019 [Aureobasidium subglaciale EXF-2481]KAI5204887.1 hypothetical protein E4T38_04476 [Aureobasidium subglaciale]KAI5223941.1 hypothetical protein E4T40_04252 [Aureobasidium subglaciale]KAI5227465.1 hypothetical protein E4T41_04334 [Aureobasidium subglaciale]KAI5262689.1 hypothetical protein E4T46_04220 [Aureobasidium subglaciale]KEQ95414.1 hypothetical protein AUEXF2481DRAFT_5019 [Aureobasidium subglaciale EXF-2481]
MADDDNFDIDIYGDDEQDLKPEPQPKEEQKQHDTETSPELDGTDYAQQVNEPETEPPIDSDVKLEGDPDEMKVQYEQSHGAADSSGLQEQQQIHSTTGSSADQYNVPKQAPTEQGTKRKEGEDSREVDPGATSALRLGELQWWISEDDIRGWANQCGCEDELKEVTFNEHKVNGKSKGEAFVELASPQAATALKHRIDSFGADQQYVKKHTCIYVRPDYNPFKTSPKDAPQRGKVATPGAYNNGPAFQQSSGFRGGRGGYTRGGMNNMNTGMNMGGMGRGGFNNPQMNMMGGFNGGAMAGNFNNNNMMGGFNNNAMGGFNNRGGMMGGNMRGGFQNNRGRGGMMMPNMGMGMGMGMGNMGMNNMNNMGAMGAMNMGNMGNMGMGNFSNNTQGGHFNPGFFGAAANGNATGGGMSPNGNPHGAKRPRPE